MNNDTLGMDSHTIAALSRRVATEYNLIERNMNMAYSKDKDGGLIDPPILPEHEARIASASASGDADLIADVQGEYDTARREAADKSDKREEDRERKRYEENYQIADVQGEYDTARREAADKSDKREEDRERKRYEENYQGSSSSGRERAE